MDASVVYGDAAKRWPPRYRCMSCGAHVGTHAKTDPPEPLGTLANREVRALRRQCHDVFDKYWLKPRRGRKLRRRHAYLRLATFMGMTKDEAHISSWQREKCLLFLSLAGEFDYYMNTGKRRKP